MRIYYQFGQIEEAAAAIGSETNQESNLQFGVGVSKKYFKKAVDRNRIKRLIREAYRLQKGELLKAVSSKKPSCLRLFFIYTAKELPDFELVKQKVSEALVRLQSISTGN